jgi:hypothetical protein
MDTLSALVPAKFVAPGNKIKVKNGQAIMLHLTRPYLCECDLGQVSDTCSIIAIRPVKKLGMLLDFDKRENGDWLIASVKGLSSLVLADRDGQITRVKTINRKRNLHFSHHSRFGHLFVELSNHQGFIIASSPGLYRDKILDWANNSSKLYHLDSSFRPLWAINADWPGNSAFDLSLLSYQIDLIEAPTGRVMTIDARFPVLNYWNGTRFESIAVQADLFDSATVAKSKPYKIPVNTETLEREWKGDGLRDSLAANLAYEYETVLPLHFQNGWYGLVYRKPVQQDTAAVPLTSIFAIQESNILIKVPVGFSSCSNPRLDFALQKPVSVVLFDNTGVVHAQFDLAQPSSWFQQVGDELWAKQGYDAQTQQLRFVRYSLLDVLED